MERRVFTDPTIPAFFQAANKPIKITSQRNSQGNVEFLAEGENIDEALQELYGNAQIGVLDFLKSLKMLKSSVYALKLGVK